MFCACGFVNVCGRARYACRDEYVLFFVHVWLVVFSLAADHPAEKYLSWPLHGIIRGEAVLVGSIRGAAGWELAE